VGVLRNEQETRQALKMKTISYWATTAILALGTLSGGMAELVRRREVVEGMVHLGYPLYFVTILGFWKVLAGVALLAPGFPRLKEWTYAGIFFNMTGAVASHAVCGDSLGHLLAPGIFAVLAVASWALRPQNRTATALMDAAKAA
jgi:uncharacterized membrane protein YphA (DoxX/SURF4 family)